MPQTANKDLRIIIFSRKQTCQQQTCQQQPKNQLWVPQFPHLLRFHIKECRCPHPQHHCQHQWYQYLGLSAPLRQMPALIPANSQQVSSPAYHQQSLSPQESQISAPQISVPCQPWSTAHQQKSTQQISAPLIAAPYQQWKEAQRRKSAPQKSFPDMEAHLAIYHIYYLIAKQIPEPTVKNIKTQSIPYFNYMAVIGSHLADNRTYPSCLPINSTNWCSQDASISCSC